MNPRARSEPACGFPSKRLVKPGNPSGGEDLIQGKMKGATMKLLIPALASTALLVTACSDNASDRGQVEGPVVSGSEAPRNPAVDTGGGDTLTPGANSFTEAQARSAIEKQGYVVSGPLSQDAQGVWRAPAAKDGAVAVGSIQYKGVVSAGAPAR